MIAAKYHPHLECQPLTEMVYGSVAVTAEVVNAYLTVAQYIYEHFTRRARVNLMTRKNRAF
jgi:hypothetical protein